MMDELFSCRNCIHNSGQSLNIGPGAGYCLQHESVVWQPEVTTCKYLHRKDLPQFVVAEGIQEHAAEFSLFPRLVNLHTRQPIEQIHYSEKFSWERRQFDPLNHALAQYHKTRRRWVFIQAFTAGADGRRSLAHASLIRHYMDHCGTWVSSYRLVLGLLEEIDDTPSFTEKALVLAGELKPEEATREALWDVVFSRLAAIQEYGWHSGLEELMWATDTVNGSLTEMKWDKLKEELALWRRKWEDLIIKHAENEGEFFPPTVMEDGDMDEER
jgi:hypothetical protein